MKFKWKLKWRRLEKKFSKTSPKPLLKTKIEQLKFQGFRGAASYIDLDEVNRAFPKILEFIETAKN